MRDPSGRLLRLLSLLQTPREWPGTALAERLGVTPRTIRRDIDRLRELGYPVHARHGNAGGYRLTAGTAMPPLVLDDDEAIAMAIGLRTATATAITGIEDASLRALAKLEQVLPARLRHRVTSLSEAAVAMSPAEGAPVADAGVLASLAGACVAHEKVRFAHTRGDGQRLRRLVEPHSLVAAFRRWYLVAYDEGRSGWRTFRVDRITEVHRTGVRVPARALPGEVDAATWVMRAQGDRAGNIRARLLLHAPIEWASENVPSGIGALESAGDRTCILHTIADSPRYLAYRLVLLPVDYTLLDPPELATHLAAVAARTRRAIQDPGHPEPAG
jgi:predicted DNA-binding transcriptional regulator YafY